MTKKKKTGKPRQLEIDSNGADLSPLPSPFTDLGERKRGRGESYADLEFTNEQLSTIAGDGILPPSFPPPLPPPLPPSVLRGNDYVRKPRHLRNSSSVSWKPNDEGAPLLGKMLNVRTERDSDDDDDDPDLSFLFSGDDTENNDGDKDETATRGFSVSVKSVFEDAWGAAKESVADFEDRTHYDWTEFYKPTSGTNRWFGTIRFVRWLATGLLQDTKQSDDEVQENLNSLARLLSLLREYHERFGMPIKGGIKDREYILREVTKDLYAGGAPIWALEPVMKKISEGLTGRTDTELFMLPRRTFVCNSDGTRMVKTVRGYDMQKLDAMETIAVRLASFASNTSSTSSIPARFPEPSELREAYRTESLAGYVYSKEEMAEEILTLASEAEGLFFYINSRHEKVVGRQEKGTPTSNCEEKQTELGEFWTVEDSIKELFSRLAAIEAVTSIDKIDMEKKQLYSDWMFSFFRFAASAGACAFWFNGSWFDILVSGTLAVLVAWIGASPLLSQHERIIFEAVAGLLVGLIAGLISITWPNNTCFGAMAISGVLDLLQGFRVVYAIIEIMSRHTVTGGADFLEGILFTSLIGYFLKFGQLAAVNLLGEPADDTYLQCNKGVNHLWILFFVPLASIAWSGLFNPHYLDIPFMAAHGVLGYVVSQQFFQPAPTNVNNFVAASAVTFSAGLISRFTGRQALGNTVAGLYVLLPGAYMVDEVYKSSIETFLSTVIQKSVIIGIGAWTGSILCSPTLLGTNRGFVQNVTSGQGASVLAASWMNDDSEHTNAHTSFGSTSRDSSGRTWRRREKSSRKAPAKSLLYF